MTFSSKISHFEVSKARQEKHEVFCCYSLEGKLKHEFLSLLCFSSWSQYVYSLSPEEKKSKREKGDFQHFFLLGTAIIEVTDICVLNIRQAAFVSMIFEAQADCKWVPSSSGVKERHGSGGSESRVLQLVFSISTVSPQCLNSVIISKFFTSNLKTFKSLAEELNSAVINWFRSRLNRRKRKL